MRLTKNPFQRGAGVCALVAAIVSIAGAQAASLIPLAVGVVLAVVAYARRRDFPR